MGSSLEGWGGVSFGLLVWGKECGEGVIVIRTRSRGQIG
jgi:hypothetical protein